MGLFVSALLFTLFCIIGSIYLDGLMSNSPLTKILNIHNFIYGFVIIFVPISIVLILIKI